MAHSHPVVRLAMMRTPTSAHAQCKPPTVSSTGRKRSARARRASDGRARAPAPAPRAQNCSQRAARSDR
eukprot:8964294-Pyramimonas_sp.AAC.1